MGQFLFLTSGFGVINSILILKAGLKELRQYMQPPVSGE